MYVLVISEWADLTDRALDLEDTFINATSSSRYFYKHTYGDMLVLQWPIIF